MSHKHSPQSRNTFLSMIFMDEGHLPQTFGMRHAQRALRQASRYGRLTIPWANPTMLPSRKERLSTNGGY